LIFWGLYGENLKRTIIEKAKLCWRVPPIDFILCEILGQLRIFSIP